MNLINLVMWWVEKYFGSQLVPVCTIFQFDDWLVINLIYSDWPEGTRYGMGNTVLEVQQQKLDEIAQIVSATCHRKVFLKSRVI